MKHTKLLQLAALTLRHCKEKIEFYFEKDQEYVGGIEASRLISNINTVLTLLQETIREETILKDVSVSTGCTQDDDEYIKCGNSTNEKHQWLKKNRKK